MNRPELWGWSTSPLTIAFWGWEDARELLKARRGFVPAIVHSAQAQWVTPCWPPASAAVHFEVAQKSVCAAIPAKSVAGPATASVISCFTTTCSIVCRTHTAKAQVSRAAGKVVEDVLSPPTSSGRLDIDSQAREHSIAQILI